MTEGRPFGGIKEPGIGREGSRYGIEDYTEMKAGNRHPPALVSAGSGVGGQSDRYQGCIPSFPPNASTGVAVGPPSYGDEWSG